MQVWVLKKSLCITIWNKWSAFPFQVFLKKVTQDCPHLTQCLKTWISYEHVGAMHLCLCNMLLSSEVFASCTRALGSCCYLKTGQRCSSPTDLWLLFFWQRLIAPDSGTYIEKPNLLSFSLQLFVYFKCKARQCKAKFQDFTHEGSLPWEQLI